MSINETNDSTSVVDNIINEMNNEQQNIQQPIQQPPQQVQIDPNVQRVHQKPSFNINNYDSNTKIMNFLKNFRSSIIVAILIILFSFPQVNKLGKLVLNVSFINNLKYSYVFPYLVNGLLGGVIYYYLSNLNI